MCFGIRCSDPARRGDEAVAAFLLHAGQAARGTCRSRPCRGLPCGTCAPAISSVSVSQRRVACPSRPMRPFELEARHRRIVDLAEVVVEARDFEPVAVRRRPCASDARLSSAVPHSTAFLPPAFIATLPPMHDASAEVGSTANTKPARSAASATRWVTTPAPV